MEPMNSGTASRYAPSDRARHGLSPGANAGLDSLFVPIAIAIFAVAIFLRVFHLDYLSLWNDEIFSRYYYDLFGAKFLVTTGLTIEPTPPLYYFLLEPWMAAFGHSESAMRSLSVVASLIALPLVYAVARDLSNRAIALTAAALFAVSPMAVYFSQEARVYMFTVIPAALMLLGIARFLREARNGDLVLYAVGAIVALYSHATFTFMVAACNAIVIAYLWLTPVAAREPDAGPRRAAFSRMGATVRWLVANVVVGLAYLPLLVPMLSIGKHGTGLSWIPPLSFRDLLVAMSALVMGPITEMRFPGVELSGLLIAVVAVVLMLAIMPRRALAVVVGIPVLFVALVTIASLKQPILIPRILCWMTLPLAVVLAYAIVVPSKLRIVARLAALLAIGVGLYWQIALADGAKPPFREIFSETRAELTHADDVVLAPYASAVLLKYYGPPVIKNLQKWHDPAVTGIESNQMIEQFGIPLRTRQQVIDDIKSGKSVAMVVTSPDARFMPALMDNVPPPQRRVESTCNIVPRHGVQPPPCIAVYGWNMPSNAPVATQAPQ
ncbi:glycosyltransferase family 39 protein [Paraburkholderia phosphatilytica]|uniref:glycosyltransferase family 39 protein n=1 Tax=Paraburkholderia phosphatilytica TaxID=2282883 RepID=UPI000E51F8EA|nr:glycosyltransferase family 39 protein [Paraburkholderia phosphatilytica]